ncbi:MAG TPA: urease accessory protein UreD [Polyangiaceae bacterium]
MPVAEVSYPSGWRARLELEFERRGARTILARRLHEGPLVVQRPFYPEPDGTCHLYLLHPPGGIAGGDELELALEVKSGHALVTTPAATKIYRTRGPESRVIQALAVRSGAVLEWLPQESIVFGGSRASTLTRVELEPGARFLGWEIVCLGRPASGDAFASGELDQRVELLQNARPLVLDRLRAEGGGAERRGAWGFGGRSVYGCLWATGTSPALVAELRESVQPSVSGELFSVTALGEVTVCRFLGTSGERARRLLASAWGILRRNLLGKAACAPRIWAT